jgi:hypothetical protein
MSANFYPEPNRATQESAKDQSGPTRREGIAAAAGGVSGFLAAQALARPTPARGSHIGPVLLGHENATGGEATTIASPGPSIAAFAGKHLRPQGRHFGVEGWVESDDNAAAGVHGVANAFTGSAATGVLGVSRGEFGAGVRGVSLRPSGVGVLAENQDGGIAFRARGPARIAGDLKVGPSNANPALQVAATDPAPGQTAILVRRNVGGTFSTQRVSMGPPNSGGAGFRVLRVPN